MLFSNDKAKRKNIGFRDLKAWQKALIITGIIVLVLCLLLTWGINSLLNKINRAENMEPVDPSDEFFETDGNENRYDVVDPDSIKWPENSETLEGSGVTNILLIGQDRREGETRARSDSMIIVSIDKQSKAISLISLMRDTYVQIPGYSDNRINAAYAFGGMELLDKTIELNFGVKVDANVEVDFEGFMAVIDVVGGIDVNLSKAEANYINSIMGKRGTSELDEGIVHMDGETALTYARIRSLAGSDFARTERQRKVISAVINKARTSNLSTIMEFIDKLLPLVTTDLTNAEILSYAAEYFPLLADSSINMFRIPADGDYYDASIRGMSVLVPDITACREMLSDIIYG